MRWKGTLALWGLGLMAVWVAGKGLWEIVR